MIGRILADVRKEEFEKRFGLPLDQQDKRIEEHEERIEKIKKVDRKPNITVIQQTVVSPPPPPRRIPKRDDNRFFQEFDEPEPAQKVENYELAGVDIEELKRIARERNQERSLLPAMLLICAMAFIFQFAKSCGSGPH